jgi:Family of unknown function (DUF5675)
MERTVTLARLARSDQGTEGVLLAGDFNCKTLELPWRKNQKQISCIPPGKYEVTLRLSNKYGRVYWVTKVPNRTAILIHSGNYAGDVSKGFKSHVMGCILLGQKMGFLAGQRAVLNSRITVRRFMEEMGYDQFELNVLDSIGG